MGDMTVTTLETYAAGAHRWRVEYRKRVAETPAPAGGPWPAPEVVARLATVSEVPRGALVVQRAAQRAGWLVVPTYARGTALAARGKPGKVVDSLALRMRRPSDGLRAVAVWIDGGFCIGYAWRPGVEWPGKVNVTDLRIIFSEDGVAKGAEAKIGSSLTQVHES